jgi:hypothetical protein
MRDKCYHGVTPFLGVSSRKVCNFSGYNIVIARLFGHYCPFEWNGDLNCCKGYLKLEDPRQKDSEE